MAKRKKPNDGAEDGVERKLSLVKPTPSLADLVAAREGQSPRSGKNKAAVLALQEDIEATVARGFSIKAIYSTLVDTNWATLKEHGYSDKAIKELDMTYETFRNLCGDLGLKKTPSSTRSKAAKARPRKR